MRASLSAVMLVLSACSGASDDTALLSQHDLGAGVTDDSDSPAANCPGLRVNNPQENGSEQWLWSVSGDEASDAASVASDRFGNAYVTRADGGTAKLSASGELLFGKPYGTHVAVLANDDVVVAASFAGSVDIDGVRLDATLGRDVYVVRLDAAGVVKQRVVLGSAADDELVGLAADHSGRSVVSATNLGTTVLDAEGKTSWTRPLSGAVAVDPSDNVLVTGSFSGTQDFGGGALTSAGGLDVFVAKLGPEGEHLFSARYGDAGSQQLGKAIAADLQGNIWLSGVFDGSLDFGAGALSPARCPAEVWCQQSGFVAKLAANGAPLVSIARGPLRALSGIATDSAGNVFVSGASPGGVPSYRIPLLMKFDAEGEPLWERSEWPASGVGSGRQVAVDACGQVLWSLSVRPNLDAGEHAYLAKLTP
jgi:hypothetical protein